MTQFPISVAIAILDREGKFLLQLRDDIPGILYRGHWGLFGGHLELGETPTQGLIRELLEEINYPIVAPREFRCYNSVEVIRHVFYAPLTVTIDKLILKEGADLGLFSPEDIRSGYCYSSKLAQSRPIGLPHQQILLDFLQKFGR
jgi:8-oxo-dGTP diphosphatase